MEHLSNEDILSFFSLSLSLFFFATFALSEAHLIPTSIMFIFSLLYNCFYLFRQAYCISKNIYDILQ